MRYQSGSLANPKEDDPEFDTYSEAFNHVEQDSEKSPHGIWTGQSFGSEADCNSLGARSIYAMSPDSNVEAVRQKLLQRSIVGLEKYGVTTERDDLSDLQWLIHLHEEILDASVYLQRIISRMEQI